MIYEFNARLVVQKELTGSKYTLQVISASTEQNSTIPTAEIEVVANNGSTDYLSDIEFFDIVWLETSIRFSQSEKIVWKKLFEGRIISRREQWGTGTTATLACIGHAYEPSVRIIPEASSFASTTDSKTILNVVRTYLTRSEITVPYAATFNTTYSIKAYQKYIKDVMEDMIAISGNTYYFDTVVYYSAAKLVTGAEIQYKLVPASATTQYSIRSGTPRLLEAHFESDGGNVWNYIVQLGQKPDENSQYQAGSSDSTSIARYGSRELVNIDTSLTSFDMCQDMANGLLPIIKDPVVTGSATLFLTPEAKYKDLVTIQIDRIQVSNIPLNVVLRVERVSHNISRSGCTTSLEFGVRKTQDDYTAEFKRKNRITMSQFVE
jgi:hypothetical protein